MTSKKQLRAEIDLAWGRGFLAADGRTWQDWAQHLAQVADAARDEGRREGWKAAWTAGGCQGDPDCQEVNRFSCGFSCDCRTPMPEPWHRGQA